MKTGNLEPLKSMFATLQKWASFVKFSHTAFGLPFAIAAMAVAARANRGWPGWRTFGLVLAAMVCGRTCAMAFNRIVDRKLDALNPLITRLPSAGRRFTIAPPPVNPRPCDDARENCRSRAKRQKGYDIVR